MPVRLLLFSDLHLDTPFTWAGRELARARRRALRRTLQRICELAAAEGVDAILCAGDLYENDRFEADTPAFVRDTLSSAGMPVLLAPGNHDWYGPGSLYRQIEDGLPARVHLFRTDRLEAFELTPGFTVWGAAHLTPAGTRGFLGGFAVDRGGVNVGLFHGSEHGDLPFQGPDKAPHAPFTAAEVPAAGLAHAFVGHFHAPKDAPWHTYPGNPDPLNFGETGERGAVVVDVGADGSVTRRRVVVASSQVHDVVVSLDGVDHREQVADRVRQAVSGLTGLVRATLTGELAADLDVRPEDARADDLVGDGLEALVPRIGRITRSYDLEAIAAETGVRGRFVAEVLAAELDDETQRRVLVTGLRALDGRGDELEVD